MTLELRELNEKNKKTVLDLEVGRCQMSFLNQTVKVKFYKEKRTGMENEVSQEKRRGAQVELFLDNWMSDRAQVSDSSDVGQMGCLGHYSYLQGTMPLSC